MTNQFRSIGLICIIIFGLSSCSNQNSTSYYVDLNKLYEEFDYTDILKQELKQQLEPLKVEVDSLASKLRLFQGQYVNKTPSDKQVEDFAQLQQLWSERNQSYTDIEKQLVAEYDTKLWGQLNQYVKEYCKQKHIDFLFGANGSGVVMYADSTLNLTSQIIEFANDKFNGK